MARLGMGNTSRSLAGGGRDRALKSTSLHKAGNDGTPDVRSVFDRVAEVCYLAVTIRGCVVV